MKRFFILMIVAANLFMACNQIDSAQTLEEDCWVSLRPAGEISISESPLTKASTDDLYFIQIYRGSSPFALGIFDNVNDMTFNLKKGTDKYRFIVSYIKNGKSALDDHFSSIINCVYTYASDNNTYSISEQTDRNIATKLNIIYYNSVRKLYCRRRDNGNDYISTYSSHEFKQLFKAQIRWEKYCQCDDWLYGEITDYSPNGEFESLNVDLKRVGFKLKYELSGVTDGEVTVRINNNDRIFFEETTTSSTYESATHFYAFYEARNAWLYADNYSENITVSVSWKRGIGVTQDLGTTTVQIQRNCLNNIKITLGSDDRSAGMSLSVEPESSIGSSAVTIPL